MRDQRGDTSLSMKPLRLLAALISLVLPACGAGEKWVDLFNGKDLTGWTQKGGEAKFEVEGGQLVGTTMPATPNSFLCTTREYTNFILEVEFKVDPGLNSGIQIRSRAADEPTTEKWAGKPIKFPAGRVHGLQVEIDPSTRAWTAGIHCEGGGGWLNDLKENEPARKAFRQNDWNLIRIDARGDSIKTWLNGVPAADLKNDVIPTGFIALQVHGVGARDEKLHVRFRKVRIQELP